MSRHEGVSCDSCLKGNFRGKRYKCLICFDYDLCATCYETGATTTRHTTEHPMQCILTRSDFELYYGGEALSVEQPQAFTCPFCGKMGFTESTLQEHVTAEHSDTSLEIVCPVCAALPGGEPNLITDDFAAHLTLEHRTPRDLISFVDEPSGSRHVRRIPHPGRGVGGTRARRANMHFTSSGGLATLSPSNRDSMDPIAELLSQLSGVRRSATASQSSTSTQLQQLQMQLQLERQQAQVARQQLDRLPRRQTQMANTQGPSITTATTSQPATTVEASTATGANNSQFLLARCTEPELSEAEVVTQEVERANHSLFVQELLMNTLAETFSLELEVLGGNGGSNNQRANSEEDNNMANSNSCLRNLTSNANETDSTSSGEREASGGDDGSSSSSSADSGNPPTAAAMPHQHLQQAKVSANATLSSTSRKLSSQPGTGNATSRTARVAPVTTGQYQGTTGNGSGGGGRPGNASSRAGGTGTIREVPPQGGGGGGGSGVQGRNSVRVASGRESASPSARRKLQRPVDGRNQPNEPPPPH